MSVLVGRDAELAMVRRFLGKGDAQGRLLLIDGAPGIGKTAFFQIAVELARVHGYRILAARPAEVEVSLSFAGLGDLLNDGAVADLTGLPEPQRVALEVALLLRAPSGRLPHSRAVGTALLNVLRTLTEDRPLLIAVDDAQWLDQASASALRFAVRRLQDERVRLVLTRRSGTAPELEEWVDDRHPVAIGLGPLTLGALHAVLLDRIGVVLSRPVLRRIHESSGGNPMYALELGRAFAEGSVRFDAASAAPVGLEHLVASRVGRLPEDTRFALAAAAASRSPSLAQIAEALEVDDPRPILEQAAADGVIEIEGGQIRFTHPLLASAAYASLDLAEQRVLHARLARSNDDPDESARHLAHATDGPDRNVAAALETAAENVFRRGAPSLASGLAELARSLTPPEEIEDSRRRTLAEAEYRFEAGDTPAASSLVSGLIAGTRPGPGRAALWALLARFQHFAHGLEESGALLRSARVEAGEDPGLRFGIEEGLAWNLLLMRGDLKAAYEAAHAAVRLAETLGDPTALGEALAITSLAQAALGVTDMHSIQRSLDNEPAMLDLRVLRHPSFSYGYLLASFDRFDEARQVFVDLLSRAEASGDESALPTLLHHVGLIDGLAGDFSRGLGLVEEAAAVAAQEGQVPAQASALARLALIEARRGNLEQAERSARRSLDLAVPEGFEPSDPGPALARGGEVAIWALGLAALLEGRPDRAVDFLHPMTDVFRRAGYRHLGEMRFLVDTVDALSMSGSIDEARSVVAWMETMPLDRPSALGAVNMAHGLLAAAEGCLPESSSRLGEAVEVFRASPLPFELGRALLAYGKVQRRSKSKADSRRSLEEAAEVFGRIGSHRWAEAARGEAERVGGRDRSVDGFTPTEFRIAELIAAGSSNKEVAQQLYISNKAVEATLTRLYAKIGIRSRTELVRWAIDRAGTGNK